jgi:hypothetical protein
VSTPDQGPRTIRGRRMCRGQGGIDHAREAAMPSRWLQQWWWRDIGPVSWVCRGIGISSRYSHQTRRPQAVLPLMWSTRSCSSKPDPIKRTPSRCIHCRRHRPA